MSLSSSVLLSRSGLPRMRLKMKRTSKTAAPAKTFVRVVSGRRTLQTMAIRPAVKPQMVAKTSPSRLSSSLRPPAIQSMDTAIPMLTSGINQANTAPACWRVTFVAQVLYSPVNTTAGTPRRAKVVSGSYPIDGRATATIGEKPSANITGGSILTGVAPIPTKNSPRPKLIMRICIGRLPPPSVLKKTINL